MGMTQNRTTIQILKSITLPLFAKLRSVKWHFLSFVSNDNPNDRFGFIKKKIMMNY